MKHHVLKLGQTVLKRDGEVMGVEKLCVRQAGADDALVAGNDGLAAILGDHIGRQHEAVGEFGRSVAHAKALLVDADGCDDDFFGEGQIALLEIAHHHHRPLDEAGDLFEEVLVGDHRQALREGKLIGVGLDDVAAAIEIDHDLGLFERRDVVVEALHANGVRRHEAMTEGGLPGGQPFD